MKVDIIDEKKNELFSRKEVVVKVETDVIPSKEEANKIIADKFSSDAELIRIIKIEGKFGVRSFTIFADIYDSKEEFFRVVKKTKQEIDAEKKAEEEKLKAEAEAKEAEKAAAEAAKVEEEKPAEENTEEVKEGEKSE